MIRSRFSLSGSNFSSRILRITVGADGPGGVLRIRIPLRAVSVFSGPATLGGGDLLALVVSGPSLHRKDKGGGAFGGVQLLGIVFRQLHDLVHGRIHDGNSFVVDIGKPGILPGTSSAGLVIIQVLLFHGGDGIVGALIAAARRYDLWDAHVAGSGDALPVPGGGGSVDAVVHIVGQLAGSQVDDGGDHAGADQVFYGGAGPYLVDDDGIPSPWRSSKRCRH